MFSVNTSYTFAEAVQPGHGKLNIGKLCLSQNFHDILSDGP